MTYNPAIHHRRSIRLKGYDYTQAGAYFVTSVTQGRECLFGRVVDGDMQLNDAGHMVERWWAELANKYPHVIPDAAIVMPNHFHGIIVITDGPVDDDMDVGDVGADLRVRPPRVRPPRVRPNTDAGADVDGRAMGAHGMGAHIGAPLQSNDAGAPVRVDPRVRPDAGVPQIVQWFKTMTTNEYIRGVKNLGWTPFPGKLWQRNYYEHIIRDENAHNRIRQYIVNNPAQWGSDNENPGKAAR
jgi:putative transposase